MAKGKIRRFIARGVRVDRSTYRWQFLEKATGLLGPRVDGGSGIYGSRELGHGYCWRSEVRLYLIVGHTYFQFFCDHFAVPRLEIRNSHGKGSCPGLSGPL